MLGNTGSILGLLIPYLIWFVIIALMFRYAKKPPSSRFKNALYAAAIVFTILIGLSVLASIIVVIVVELSPLPHP